LGVVFFNQNADTPSEDALCLDNIFLLLLFNASQDFNGKLEASAKSSGAHWSISSSSESVSTYIESAIGVK